MNQANFSFNLPALRIQTMGNNIWEEASYIPGLSTIKAVADFSAATVKTIAAIALTIIGGIGYALHWISGSRNVPAGVFLVALAGDLVLPRENAIDDRQFFSSSAVTQFGRAVLEVIPFAGNLALGFLDGRIQIIPSQG